MRRKFILPLILGTLSISSGLFSSAQAAEPVTNTTGSHISEYRKEDPRLERRVNLRGRAVHVGQLLATLSKQSGAQLDIGDLVDGAGDDQISLALPGVKLADVMDAIWSLFSYTGAEYQWQRTGTKETAVYRLVRPLNAQRLSQRFQAEVDAAFRQELAVLYRASKASGLELDQLRKQHQVVRDFLESRISLPGVRLFFETLSEQEQQSVLSGKQDYQFQTSSLTQAGKDWIDQVFTRAGRKGNFGRKVDPIKGPGWIRFYSEQMPHSLSRTLLIEVEGLGAYGYAGGTQLNGHLTEEIETIWMLPGDLTDGPEQGKPIQLREKPKASDAPKDVAFRIEELARNGETPFLARLRPDDRQDLGAVVGNTLSDFVTRICKTKDDYHHKWRNGILLLTAPDWWLSKYQAQVIPWKVARAIREMLRNTDGLPGLADLQSVAQSLSSAQLENLGHEVSLFQKVADWRDLFLLPRTSIPAWQRLAGDGGLPVRNKDLLGLLLQKDEVANLVGDPAAAALQFQYKTERPAQGDLIRYILLRTVDSKGTVLHGAGFGYRSDSQWGWLHNPGPDDAAPIKDGVPTP